MIRRLVRDKSGMALGMVLGIVAVIAILATGMFVFSSNELKFALFDTNHSRAQYLARSGVEIASKAFGAVASEFDNPDPAAPMEPVQMDPFFLYPSKVSEGSGTGKKETYLSSNPELGDYIGRVDVTITEGQKQLGEKTYNAWIFDAVAVVEGTRATASGFSLPVSYVSSSGNATTAQGLDWLNTSGQVKKPFYKGDKVETKKIYNNVKQIVDKMPWPFNLIAGSSLDIAYNAIGGDASDLYLWYNRHDGIVVVKEELGKVTMSTAGPSKAYGWVASAIYFQERIDLRNARYLNYFVLSAPTLVFEDDIHIYANALEMHTGTLVLIPPDKGSSRVYFKGNVYMHTNTGQVKLFSAGDAFEFSENIDLSRYAMDTGKVDAGFSQILRDYLRNRSGEEKYKGNELKPLSGDEAQVPDVNSLVKVIWDDSPKGGR